MWNGNAIESSWKSGVFILRLFLVLFPTHLFPRSRQAEAAQRRKLEEEELRKRRHLEHQRAEEALAVESDPRVKTWMELVCVWFPVAGPSRVTCTLVRF